MEPQRPESASSTTVRPPACSPPERLPYEPPTAVFVALQIEERLMACAKFGTCIADQS